IEPSYDGWSVASFLEGAELLRGLEQDGLAPDIARLSDEHETRLNVALAAAARRLVRGGALPLGPSPGHGWAKSRFAGPHLRDDLLDRGVVVETLETATSWSNLERLYRAVVAALPGLHVGCHVSHLYPTGASL